MNGKKVVPQKMESGNRVSFAFIASDDNGIYEYASQSIDDHEPKIFDPPKYILRFPIEVGRSWEINSEIQRLMYRVPITLKATIQSINDTVTVPAGTFKKCVKVVTTGSTKKNLGMFMGTAKIEVKEFSWYAPNVGLVKMIREEKSNHLLVGAGEISIHLTNYK